MFIKITMWKVPARVSFLPHIYTYTHTAVYCSSMQSVPLHYLMEVSRYSHKPVKSNCCQLTLHSSAALSQPPQQTFANHHHSSLTGLGHTTATSKTCAGTRSEVAKKQEKGKTAHFSSNPSPGWFKLQAEVSIGSCSSTTADAKDKLLDFISSLSSCFGLNYHEMSCFRVLKETTTTKPHQMCKDWLFFSFFNYLKWCTARPESTHPKASQGTRTNCSSLVRLTDISVNLPTDFASVLSWRMWAKHCKFHSAQGKLQNQEIQESYYWKSQFTQNLANS